MKFLAVDDEPRALKDICEALEEAVLGCESVAFTSPAKALEYGKLNPIDVAFLDIEMGRVSGLVLAKKLKDVNPKIHIIFVTSYEKYAVDAFRLHATGYLMKPARAEDIQRELTFLYGNSFTEQPKKIRMQTFGGFDIYVNDQPLSFKRSKSKELLAYLVDRRGLSITTREACDILFEDGGYDISRKNYFQTIVSELHNVLKRARAEHILLKKRNSFAVDIKAFECDSYRFLEGDPIAVNNYRRDYMICYSWAEFTMGIMESEL